MWRDVAADSKFSILSSVDQLRREIAVGTINVRESGVFRNLHSGH